MMMEQQRVLKNDKMQEKWKSCVLNTCYAYRIVERVKEVVDSIIDVVRRIINSLAEVFKPMVANLTLAFKDFIDEVSDLCDSEKSYPQSYPHYVNKLKLNTIGFPRPIIYCARSRC